MSKSKKEQENLSRTPERESLNASNIFLNNILNAAGDPVFVKDEESKFVFVNDALCNMLGIARENILGKTLRESLPEDQMEHSLTIDKLVLESGIENQCEELLTGKGEKTRITVTKKSRYINEHGMKLLIGVIHDITEHKQTEARLKDIEWMLSPKPTQDRGRQADTIGHYGDLTELNLNGIILKSMGQELLKTVAEDYLELIGTCSAIYEKNGDYALGLFSSGWCRMMDCASRKLCDTQENAEALNSRRWLCHESCWTHCARIAIENCTSVDIECSGGLRIYCEPIMAGENVVGAINFGYGDPPKNGATLQKLADTYHVEYDDLVREVNTYQSRPPYIIEMAKKRLHATARLIGSIVEKKLVEDALSESEKEKSLILDNVGDIIAYHDKNGRIAWANQAYLDSVSIITGSPVQIADVKGGPCYEVWKLGKPCVGCPVTIALQTGKTNEAELYPDNQPHWPATQGSWYVRATPLRDIQGNVIGVIELSRDITERKKLEDALKNSQKLESLGVLAGGIAHDFNNLLGGIFGYIDLASEQTKEGNVTSYLSKAMNSIERARALTRHLLTFAKGGAPIQQIGTLFPFVQETAQFALSGSSVACNFDIPPDLWACNFDRNQIGQVIDNLIINAQQAMPVGGTIELSARNSTLAEKEHPLLAKGNYVKIAIKDAGIGIAKELITKIFDPFFTTKAKGHGLGLATCYSIINRHGGCIDVESEQGKGSTFKVYLPASLEAASAAITPTDADEHRLKDDADGRKSGKSVSEMVRSFWLASATFRGLLLKYHDFGFSVGKITETKIACLECI